MVGLKSSCAHGSPMVENLNCLKLSGELNQGLPQSVFPAVSQVKTQCYSLEMAEAGPVKSRGISALSAAGLFSSLTVALLCKVDEAELI